MASRRWFFGLAAGFGAWLTGRTRGDVPLLYVPYVPLQVSRIIGPTHRTLAGIAEALASFELQHPGSTVIAADDRHNHLLGWRAYKQYEGETVSMVCTISLRAVREACRGDGSLTLPKLT